MNNYVTANTIKTLREKKGLTQLKLAEMLSVSDKTVSKWETGKGLPDISLLEPLTKALGVSLTELFTGEIVTNKNVSANIRRMKFYICPVCGNIMTACGEAAISCCGITLPAAEAEECGGAHDIKTEKVEDEIFVTVDHEMSKSHYISFLAYLTSDRADIIKLYPEGNAEARFKPKGSGMLLAYCNRHGLFCKKI